MKRKIVALLAVAVLGTAGFASAQEDVIVIRGGQVYTLGAAGEIENGVVVIRDGRIAAVGGADTAVPDGATVIDATGSVVYPGMFDAVTRVGLTEIGQVTVTSDFAELGDNNAHLQGATAVHPASAIIPVTRANGITHVVASPNSGGGFRRGGGGGMRISVAGQGSLMNLDGWTIEEMILDAGVYMVVNWPSLGGGGRFGRFRAASGPPFSERKAQYDAAIATLEEWLADAQRYATAAESGQILDRNLKLEALGRVANGAMPLLINVRGRRDIREAIAFGERANVRIILAGASEAWKEAELLAEKNIPVILGATQSMPATEDDPYDSAYTQPAKLHEAGVTFAISTFNASSARTLPYEAGQAVAFGLPHEEGLKAVTLNPAKILGVDDQLGSIEEGKIANVVVASGDPLEINVQIEHLIIAGRWTSTDNKHKELYEKYSSRPGRDSQ